MTIDMSKYLGLFVSEALEHLDGLSQELVSLEKDGGAERVDAMFRHAHSVKGMAASMGFEAIAHLAHRMEDLVEQVRRDRSALTAEVGDALLAGADRLQEMVRAAGEGQPPASAGPVLDRISRELDALEAGQEAPRSVRSTKIPHPIGVPRLGASSGWASGSGTVPASGRPANREGRRFLVCLRVASRCAAPGVKAFLVFKKLSALGTMLAVSPGLDDLRAGRVPGGALRLELRANAGVGEEVIRQALARLSDLEAIEVELAPPPAEEPASPSSARLSPSEMVRVKAEVLDSILETVGEALLATAQLKAQGRSLPDGLREPMLEGIDRFHGLVKDLHALVMSARMTPLSFITDRLPRAARDLSRRAGREVDLVVSGAEIELDRAVLDELAEPLMHLLRNCIDHGIESPQERIAAGKTACGRIALTARRDRDRVVLEVEDDGRGMDVEALKRRAVERGLLDADAAALLSSREACLLCCLPGVSTRREVSDVSGRGVGMDAVKRALESLGGTLDIETVPGKKTRFTLRLPLTVSVIHMLLVGVGEELFGLPITKVRCVVQAEPHALAQGKREPVLRHGRAQVPVHKLAQILDIPAEVATSGPRPHVLVEAEGGDVALEVDRLAGQEEAVLKPLPRQLDLVPALSGVTILGNGRPVFILDVARLLA